MAQLGDSQWVMCYSLPNIWASQKISLSSTHELMTKNSIDIREKASRIKSFAGTRISKYGMPLFSTFFQTTSRRLYLSSPFRPVLFKHNLTILFFLHLFEFGKLVIIVKNLASDIDNVNTIKDTIDITLSHTAIYVDVYCFCFCCCWNNSFHKVLVSVVVCFCLIEEWISLR